MHHQSCFVHSHIRHGRLACDGSDRGSLLTPLMIKIEIWQSEEESIIDILRFYEQPIKRGLKMQNLLPVHGVRGQVH